MTLIEYGMILVGRRVGKNWAAITTMCVIGSTREWNKMSQPVI